MPSLGVPELLVILLIAITLFGVGRLGDVGGAMGKSIREFRKAADGGYDEKPEEKKSETTSSNS